MTAINPAKKIQNEKTPKTMNHAGVELLIDSEFWALASTSGLTVDCIEENNDTTTENEDGGVVVNGVCCVVWCDDDDDCWDEGGGFVERDGNDDDMSVNFNFVVVVCWLIVDDVGRVFGWFVVIDFDEVMLGIELAVVLIVVVGLVVVVVDIVVVVGLFVVVVVVVDCGVDFAVVVVANFVVVDLVVIDDVVGNITRELISVIIAVVNNVLHRVGLFAQSQGW